MADGVEGLASMVLTPSGVRATLVPISKWYKQTGHSL